jgi:valyl-tRNA synthetase
MYDASTSIHQTAWPEPLALDADFEAGETAMAVVGALRKYKSENQLSMNADLDVVEVYGDVSGFEDDISGVMHVDSLQMSDEEPPVESVVTGVDLDYSLVGPEFGSQVPDIEAALAQSDYDVVDGELHVAGAELDAEMFEITEERQFVGEGDMVEASDTVVVVRN